MRTPEYQPRVALAGVPNVGKTTVFNQPTGLRALCVQPRGGKKTVNLFFRFEGIGLCTGKNAGLPWMYFPRFPTGPGTYFKTLTLRRDTPTKARSTTHIHTLKFLPEP